MPLFGAVSEAQRETQQVADLFECLQFHNDGTCTVKEASAQNRSGIYCHIKNQILFKVGYQNRVSFVCVN